MGARKFGSGKVLVLKTYAARYEASVGIHGLNLLKALGNSHHFELPNIFTENGLPLPCVIMFLMRY